MKYEKIEDKLISKINASPKLTFSDIKPHIEIKEKKKRFNAFSKRFVLASSLSFVFIATLVLVVSVTLSLFSPKNSDAGEYSDRAYNEIYEHAPDYSYTDSLSKSGYDTDSIIVAIENGTIQIDKSAELIYNVTCNSLVTNDGTYDVNDAYANEIRNNNDGKIYVVKINGNVYYCQEKESKITVLNK